MADKYLRAVLGSFYPPTFVKPSVMTTKSSSVSGGHGRSGACGAANDEAGKLPGPLEVPIVRVPPIQAAGEPERAPRIEAPARELSGDLIAFYGRTRRTSTQNASGFAGCSTSSRLTSGTTPGAHEKGRS